MSKGHISTSGGFVIECSKCFVEKGGHIHTERARIAGSDIDEGGIVTHRYQGTPCDTCGATFTVEVEVNAP